METRFDYSKRKQGNRSYYAYMYIHTYPSKVVVIHSKSTSSGLDNPWIPAGTLLWAPPALVQSMRISNENMLLVQVSLGFCSNSSTISQELYRFLSFQGSKKASIKTSCEPQRAPLLSGLPLKTQALSHVQQQGIRQSHVKVLPLSDPSTSKIVIKKLP